MRDQEKCCPKMVDGKQCDYLDFVYRMTNYTDVRQDNRNQRVAVEVALHVRVERCTGPLQLGNLIYSTTLLPGEKVRLYTQDRRSRFSFDTESQLSYRHEQSAEEQYYMDSFEGFMSDIESVDRTSEENSSSGGATGKGKTSGLLGSIFSGPSASVSGSFNAQSTRDFIRELRVHAESSHNRSVQSTRVANSTQVGEVQSRTHAEGESESHFESNSRRFENRNQCHSVSYLFYQVDKCQTTKFTIEAIKTRVIDPAAESATISRPQIQDSKLLVVPTGIRAAVKPKKVAAAADLSGLKFARFTVAPEAARIYRSPQIEAQPLPDDVRKAALKQVTESLVANKMLTKDGKISSEVRSEINFEFKTSIPTAGVVVKGCLDDCNTCEDSRKKSIELDLKHQELQNKLLAKQIELLEKSSEYRCCPAGEEEPASEDPLSP